MQSYKKWDPQVGSGIDKRMVWEAWDNLLGQSAFPQTFNSYMLLKRYYKKIYTCECGDELTCKKKKGSFTHAKHLFVQIRIPIY